MSRTDPLTDPEQRRQAVLEAINSTAPDATAFLLHAMTDDDPIVREWAVEGLGRRKMARPEAVAALVGCLRDDRRADLRWYAARALGNLGLGSDEVRAALQGALDDHDEYVRAFAAWALGQLRMTAPEIIQALRQRLSQLRRSSLEAQVVGVALARLHTDPTAAGGEDGEQGILFESIPPVEALPRELPKPKQAILDELGRMALAVQSDRHGWRITQKTAIATAVRIYRSVAAKERAVSERGPGCQVCNFRFRKKDGNEYYEGHHIEPVSRGGTDDDWNLLVLCANHHRQLHYALIEWPAGTKRPPVVIINADRYPIRWNP
jgi:HEAT repeats/HNH endonuclease/PBS lyase HEAT-like repeat